MNYNVAFGFKPEMELRMKVTLLLTKVVLGLLLMSVLLSASCCISKAFNKDHTPYVQDLQPPGE